MRKYGKWVLTLSLLAATPGLTSATDPQSTGANPSRGVRTPRIDNQRMAENIANALRDRVSGADINIEYKDGVAVLSGSVADPKMKKLATTLTEQVPNVVKVENRMTVAEKKRSLVDRALGRSASNDVVQAGLANDPPSQQRIQQVNATYPQGDVPAQAGMTPPPLNYGAGQPVAPVQQAAPKAPTNQDVAQQIGVVLTEARLDGYDIQIRYTNGVAMLEGSVGSQAERAAATRAVYTVPGVRSVTNRLMCSEDYAAQAGGRDPYATQAGGRDPYAQANARSAGPMVQPAAAQMAAPPGYQGGPAMGGGMPMGPGGVPCPPGYGAPNGPIYNSPSMPDHAWPTYAQYPNSAAVSYPQQYSASAWPYIGPFYPYPQVPLGWRDATLRWDDGQWNLMFKPRTDRWWWFFNPNNW